MIQDIETHFSDPFMPVYVFSNHDKHRSIHRLGNDIRKAKLLHLLQLTVRGVPCMYYGEEIGMTDLPMPFNTALDPIPHKFRYVPRFVFDVLGLTISRDEVRTPMQWDGTKNAGCSSAEKTWLPVHWNYNEINVDKENKEEDSLLNVIRALLKIRREEIPLQEGSLELISGLPNGVLGYSRRLEHEKIVILLNFDEREKAFHTGSSEYIFKLSPKDEIKNKAIRLDGFGGVIIKIPK